jgi:hypothetical protein
MILLAHVPRPDSTMGPLLRGRIAWLGDPEPVERARLHPNEGLESEMWSTPEYVIWLVTHN